MGRLQSCSKAMEKMKEQHQSADDATALEGESFTVKPLSGGTTHYSGEFSHWNFSHKVRQKVDHYLGSKGSAIKSGSESQAAKDDASKPKYVEYWRATQLQGPGSRVRDALSMLPPRSIAEFLARVYFEFAQVNSFFVEERWLYGKLELLYMSPEAVDTSSAAWVCSVVLVLAVGTQFAHMDSGELSIMDSEDDGNEGSDKEAGTIFYQAATTLIPDIITMASLESVQACLLLAHYTLPLDTHGLAYTYLGLAIKMAIQNGMHRKHKDGQLDGRTVEIRNRLWWTAVTVERRVSVLHGRPASITAIEMDADLPTDLFELQKNKQPSRFDTILALIHLTGGLGDVATALTFLKKCPKDLQATYFERLLSIRERLIGWWSALPDDIQNPSASSPLFRTNAHLKLNYHLVQIFTGRPFVFFESTRGPSHERSSRRAVLVSDALDAAFSVITLPELLHDEMGLARASYTEFSSCRAALLLLLAQSFNKSTDRSRMAITQGMKFIKLMSIGSNVSNKSETSLIETIELAVRRIHSQSSRGQETDNEELEDTYDRFKEWASLCVEPDGVNIQPPSVSSESIAANKMPHMIFPETSASWSDVGDIVEDLLNWTREVSQNTGTIDSLDIFPDSQMEDQGFMMTPPSESWEGHEAL